MTRPNDLNLPAELKAALVLRSEKYLSKLSDDELDDFIDERQRIMEHTMASARQVGAVCAVLIGRSLHAKKARLRYGEFRAWAEMRHHYKPSTITLYLKCARQADQLIARNVSIEGLSVRGLLAMSTPPRETAAQQRNLMDGALPAAHNNRQAGEINRLLMTLSWYLEKAPELFEAVAVPELEQLVKKSHAIRKRAAAVRDEE